MTPVRLGHLSREAAGVLSPLIDQNMMGFETISHPQYNIDQKGSAKTIHVHLHPLIASTFC